MAIDTITPISTVRYKPKSGSPVEIPLVVNIQRYDNGDYVESEEDIDLVEESTEE